MPPLLHIYLFVYFQLLCLRCQVSRTPKPCCAAPEWPSPPHSRGDILQGAASLLQPPSFFSPKNICCSWRMEENVLISLSSSTQDSWFFCASVILLYLITIIMMTIYLICLFFYYSILWLSCSSPIKQRSIIIFNHVAASKSKCFSNIKSQWTWLIIFTLPQLQWGLD